MAMILKHIFPRTVPRMVINVQIFTKRCIKNYSAVDIQIISTEAIKPSFPTPKHLATYKLSLFDKFCSSGYMPLVFFYSAKHEDFKKTSDLLKISLSKTLTQYYPFAGRFNVDKFSVDCNDDGAAFIEAHVNDDMSKFLQPPNMELLPHLIPSIPKILESEISSRELLVVQVNYFSSGGMAIGVCLWHGVADGSELSYFMKLWGEITRAVNGSANDHIRNVVLDCSSLFPPQNILEDFFIKSNFSHNVVSKRLLFDGKKLASLKERVNKEMGSFDSLRASRFTVVSALIWGASIAIARERKRACAMNYTMSLRNNIVNSPINSKYIGNIFRFVRAEWSAEDVIEVTCLARELMKAKRMGSDVVNGIEYLHFVKDMIEEWDDLRSFNVSSLIGMPFYEADFGWGKPVWFSIGTVPLPNLAILQSTSDDEGVEAKVMMFKEDMDKFEQDPRILAYASSNPSINV